jgi:adenine deaminase
MVLMNSIGLNPDSPIPLAPENIRRPSPTFKNCRLFDVGSREIYPTDISVDGGLVCSTEPAVRAGTDEVVDGECAHAAPGHIGPHMHVDTNSND